MPDVGKGAARCRVNLRCRDCGATASYAAYARANDEVLILYVRAMRLYGWGPIGFETRGASGHWLCGACWEALWGARTKNGKGGEVDGR